MEDAFDGNVYGVVVAVDRFWVVRATGWAERLRGRKEGFDRLVAQNQQAVIARRPLGSGS